MADHKELLTQLYSNIARVIVGKNDPIVFTLVTLLCRGHLLLEDAPGLGKTMLARSLAKSLKMDFKRVQCTPDLLPSDITGVAIYNQQTGGFDFVKGPVFTNILLADEINRTTPRTQSALLEAMAENQVTVDGTTHILTDAFMVIATQNPIEFHGTYPLPEAQLDRFFMRISLGYPKLQDEVKLMQMQQDHHPIDDIGAVLSPESIVKMQKAVTRIHVEPSVQHYIAEIVAATRHHPDIELGASPRGSLALMKASQAMAYVNGQTFVDPGIIKRIIVPVLGHRIIPKSQAQLSGKGVGDILKSVLESVAVPVKSA